MSQKPVHEVFDLIEYASQMLKKVGFEVSYVSRQSEAVYYRFPGRDGLLRLATHSKNRTPFGLNEPVSKLTFNGDIPGNPGKTKSSLDALDNRIHAAIGKYFANSKTITASGEKWQKVIMEATIGGSEFTSREYCREYFKCIKENLHKAKMLLAKHNLLNELSN